MSIKETYLSLTGEEKKFAIVGKEIKRTTIESLLEGHIPGLLDALKIAKALGVTVEDLVFGDVKESGTEEPGFDSKINFNSTEEVLRDGIVKRMVRIAGCKTIEDLATKELKVHPLQITNFIKLNTDTFYPHIVDFAIKHNKSLDELFGKSHTEFLLRPHADYLSTKEKGYISMVHQIYAKGQESTIEALENHVNELYRLMKIDPKQTKERLLNKQL
ncbi:MAG: hypothetical protein ACUZ8O_02440 [Candidatus Anammoxibacter sp.]